MNPITREESYLSAIAGNENPIPSTPLTRKEHYLAKLAGQDVEVPTTPLTREECYLAAIIEHGIGEVDIDSGATATDDGEGNITITEGE